MVVRYPSCEASLYCRATRKNSFVAQTARVRSRRRSIQHSYWEQCLIRFPLNGASRNRIRTNPPRINKNDFFRVRFVIARRNFARCRSFSHRQFNRQVSGKLDMLLFWRYSSRPLQQSTGHRLRHQSRTVRTRIVSAFPVRTFGRNAAYVK